MVQRIKAFLWQGDNEWDLAITFRCRGGKHRSVGSAEMARWGLIQLGYDVNIKHVSLERHAWRSWCKCNACAQIDTVHLDEARKMWLKLYNESRHW